MNTRYFLVSDGKIYAIWQADPQSMITLLEDKPQFEIIKPGGYPTRAEAESERQRLQKSKKK